MKMSTEGRVCLHNVSTSITKNNPQRCYRNINSIEYYCKQRNILTLRLTSFQSPKSENLKTLPVSGSVCWSGSTAVSFHAELTRLPLIFPLFISEPHVNWPDISPYLMGSFPLCRAVRRLYEGVGDEGRLLGLWDQEIRGFLIPVWMHFLLNTTQFISADAYTANWGDLYIWCWWGSN